MTERPTPTRKVSLNVPRASFMTRADGALLVTPLGSLPDYPARMTAHLEHWAAVAPERVFLAVRDAAGAWENWRYGETLAAVRRIGGALLARGLSAERPVAILSGNGIAHALLGLACLHVGVPYVPVSVAYSLAATDFSKLAHIMAVMTPGLVFAAEGPRFARAIAATVPDDAELVVVGPAPTGRAATEFAALLQGPETGVAAAAAAVNGDSVGKILFTSGSTGMPKGVINTHRMLAANQAMMQWTFPVLTEEPPVLLDWLPWNHTFGGNHNFGLVLANGGTLYIDDGKPVPSGIAETVRNLRDIAPTAYFNVPKGYEELVPHLRRDAALRRHFFSRVSLLFYAAAGLAQHIWDAMDELAVATVGERIQWMTGLGSTETGPFALSCRPDVTGSGIIGLPVPGVDLKLIPAEGKLEARVRGCAVTPGYWRNPAQTASVFDEEGWLCLGDALRFVDPADPDKGFRFDGRIAEDFKLATGTWVSVGPLRARLIAALAPYVRDVVIAGHDRDFLAIIAIPEEGAAQDQAAAAHVRTQLAVLAGEAAGSSNRVLRAVWLEDRLSIDAGEITDKGSINQRAVLAHRKILVADLYTDPPLSHVIHINK